MYIVKYAMWYIIFVTAFTNFLLDATTDLTAWRTNADIPEFHIDFSFVVYSDKWQPWHTKF